MRSNTCLIWTSVVAVWAVSPALSSELIVVERAQAGSPVRFSVSGDVDGARIVRFEVRRPDGSRTSLSQVAIEPPYPGGVIEGPTIPAGAGGGQLVVELFDARSCQKISKDVAPIGF